MREFQRVWVTGVGVVSPLGGTREGTWQRLRNGDCGLMLLPEYGFSGGLVPFSHGISEHDTLYSMSRLVATEALIDAKLLDDTRAVLDRDRLGCVFGTSKGDVRYFADWMLARCRSSSKGDEFCTGNSSRQPSNECPWIQSWPSGVAARLAAEFECRGPLLAPVTACATGLSSVVRAAELIRDGICDVVIAGSADASITPAMLYSFRRLGVLARHNESPEKAVRPFDRERSGFLMGEGAAAFILESESHARRRLNRCPYGEWLSGGSLGDATGLTQLSADPGSLMRLIQDTLSRANVSADEIDYISLHGTATRMNDDVEARALIDVFGASPRRNPVCGSSLKGALGHLLGAAGSVELAMMMLAMRDQWVPPTLNLSDPEYDFDFVPHVGRPHQIGTALKLSLGFGGHLVAGLMRQRLN